MKIGRVSRGYDDEESGESGNVPGARQGRQAILQTLTNPENWFTSGLVKVQPSGWDSASGWGSDSVWDSASGWESDSVKDSVLP